MRWLLTALAVMIAAPLTSAAAADPWSDTFSTRAARDPWRISWTAPDEIAPTPALSLLGNVPAIEPRTEAEAQGARPVAIEYSDAYQMRRKIHKYASFATLPLFAVELALGESLYNDVTNPDPRRAAHIAVGTGIIGLFAVNTVTGAWNLFGESLHDKNGRTLRFVHSLMMMAADAGFVATSMTGPNSSGRRGALTYESDKSTHRTIAVASISVASVSYLLMLFGNH